MHISFSPWVIWYFVYFVAQVVLALAMRNSFKLPPVCQQAFYLFFFFFIVSVITRCSLFFVTTNCSRFILYAISSFVD